jgi:hypothetical protein
MTEEAPIPRYDDKPARDCSRRTTLIGHGLSVSCLLVWPLFFVSAALWVIALAAIVVAFVGNLVYGSREHNRVLNECVRRHRAAMDAYYAKRSIDRERAT